MKNLSVVIFVCGLLFAGTALATEAALDSTAASAQPAMESTAATSVDSTAPAMDAASQAKLEDIRKLMALNGSDKIVETVGQQMTDRMKTALPRVPQSFWDEFVKKVKPEDLDSSVVAVYGKYLTDTDVKALLEFYSTPAGRKSLEAMPKIQTDIYQAVQQWSRTVGQQAKADLEREGYLSNGRPTAPPAIESSAPAPAASAK
jgi:uncharacterized protein